MNPKEKSKELIYKFRKYVDCDLSGENGFEYSKDAETYNAKQCALIAVDEILNEYNDFMQTIEQFGYWQEVKQEIELL